MTKAGLTDFLSAGALTSQEKSPRARSVGQNKLNTEETPPSSTTTAPRQRDDWVGPDWSACSKGLSCGLRGEAVTEQIPAVGGGKKKTEQGVLLSCLCVLTNQEAAH